MKGFDSRTALYIGQPPSSSSHCWHVIAARRTGECSFATRGPGIDLLLSSSHCGHPMQVMPSAQWISWQAVRLSFVPTCCYASAQKSKRILRKIYPDTGDEPSFARNAFWDWQRRSRRSVRRRGFSRWRSLLSPLVNSSPRIRRTARWGAARAGGIL